MGAGSAQSEGLFVHHIRKRVNTACYMDCDGSPELGHQALRLRPFHNKIPHQSLQPLSLIHICRLKHKQNRAAPILSASSLPL